MQRKTILLCVFRRNAHGIRVNIHSGHVLRAEHMRRHGQNAAATAHIQQAVSRLYQTLQLTDAQLCRVVRTRAKAG